MLNILFLTAHSPFKTNTGAHQRTNYICRSLSKIAHLDIVSTEQHYECNIDNCSNITLEISNNYLFFYKISKFIKYFFNLIIPPIIIKCFDFFNLFTLNVLGYKDYFLSISIKKLLKKSTYDFIFIHINNIRKFGIKPSKKIIIDIDDLPELFFSSKINTITSKFVLKRLFFNFKYSISAKTSKYYTQKIINKVFMAFFTNLSIVNSNKNGIYLPNIPHNIELKNILKSKYQFMFVGLLEYQPNYFGIEYFLENIYPLIINNIPNINFNIIGKISDQLQNKWYLKYSNITIHGFVHDLLKEYETNSIVVIPIYNGSGTNIKVLEAMKLGKACVVSGFATRGFENILEDGKNILIANNDEEFAVKTIKILKNKKIREFIGENARETINNYYSFEIFSKSITDPINIGRIPEV